MTEQLIIFDTEYASWQGFLTAPEAEKKKAEIVQIAAVKVNLPDLSVAENLNLYIKPHFTPRLTEYFINLTGITDALLEQEGLPFPEAYRRFKQFAGRLPCYSHGWSLASGRHRHRLQSRNVRHLRRFSARLSQYRRLV